MSTTFNFRLPPPPEPPPEPAPFPPGEYDHAVWRDLVEAGLALLPPGWALTRRMRESL